MRASLLLVLGVVSALGGAPRAVDATTLFALVDTGELFASVDGGATWTIRSTLPVRDAVDLLRTGSGTELHLATRSGSIYLSGDGGESWNAIGAVPASDVVAIDVGIRPVTSILLLTATGTLWQSTDAGASFSVLAVLTAADHVSLTHDVDGRLCASTATGTARVSSDGGLSWTVAGALPVSDAVEVRAVGRDLLALTGSGDAWKSTDWGVSWSTIGTLSQVHVSGMVVGEGQAIHAVTREGEVAVSADGASWSWVGAINQLDVVALATDRTPTGVGTGPSPPASLVVSPPAPNPGLGVGGFHLEFVLPRPETVRITMLDVRGRRVAVRDPETFGSAGTHSVQWDPGLVSPGVYYVLVSTASAGSAGTRWVLVR